MKSLIGSIRQRDELVGARFIGGLTPVRIVVVAATGTIGHA
jgi:hypothetical protein